MTPPASYGGTPHSAVGSLQTSFGTIPSTGTLNFTAYIIGRPSEVLTKISGGCAYYATGQWVVQCGSFSTSWQVGDVLRIDFTDSETDETGSDQITLTNEAADDAGSTILTAPSESMTAPNTPGGPSTGFVNQTLSFSTTGGSSNLGHPLEYQFNWGDGTESGWGSSSGSHSYGSTGTFEVKVHVRCQYHQSKVSSWSSVLNVTVSACTLNISINPGGSGTVTKNPNLSSYTYNQTVQLTANGTGNYAFSHWSGDLSGSENPKNISMTGNKNVTANFALETVSVPNVPSGPSTGFVGQTLSYLTGGSVNNLGHAVEYQFDWGDGNQSNWLSSGSSSHAYSNTGTFQVKAQARCQTHPTVLSAYSNTLSVTISFCNLTISISPSGTGTVTKNPDKAGYNWNENVNLTANPGEGYGFNSWGGDLTGSTNPKSIAMNGHKNVTAYMLEETVSTPNQPGGPTSGFRAQSLTFTASGAISSLGHAVEYQFEWGDGTQSNWGAASGNHTYTATGSFQLRVRARCQAHPDKISGWSTVLNVTVSLCTLTVNVSPTGAGSVSKNPDRAGYDYAENVQLSATPADARYQFREWSGGLTGSTNPQTLSMTGNKSVTANFNIESISTPTKPTGPSFGMVGENLSFSTGGSVSSFGHPVEYRFSWGDGNNSNWGSASQSHAYASTGSYQVKAQARCQTHPDITSAQSVALNVNISTYTLTINIDPVGVGMVNKNPNKSDYNPNESVQLTANPSDESYRFHHWSGDLNGSSNPQSIVMNSDKNVTAHFEREEVIPPSKPGGSSEGYMGQPLTFEAKDARSTFGHELEFRFDWGDSKISNWGKDRQTHIYDSTNVYQLRAQARCKIHPTILSPWTTDVRYVWIYACSLMVAVIPEDAGYVEKYPAKIQYAYQDTVQLSAFANHGYAFDEWSGDTTGTNNIIFLVLDTTMTSITANFAQNNETVTIPRTAAGPATGIMGQNCTFSTGGSHSNFGNPVEYEFDWGNGVLSGWGDSTRTYVFQNSGLMQIRSRARSKMNASIVSLWSQIHAVTITGLTITTVIDPPQGGRIEVSPQKMEYGWLEVVSLLAAPNANYAFDRWSADIPGQLNPSQLVMDAHKQVVAHFIETTISINTPSSPQGPDLGYRAQMLSFFTTIFQESQKNEIGYQFDWGDGNVSAWGDSTQAHSYLSIGYFNTRVRARSNLDTMIVSAWSESNQVNILSCHILTAVDPPNAGAVDINPRRADYDYGTTVIITATHNRGFKFSYWNDDEDDSLNVKNILLDGDKTFVAHFEPYTSVASLTDEIPEDYQLFQNYPNPFNPETSIQYQLPERSRVIIDIFSVNGQLIRNLVDEERDAGRHSAIWPADDHFGNPVSSGVYFYRILANDFTQVNKMILIR